MGSRGRSIRLRIYFLVAIPLVAMVGLLAYVAGTSINNAIDLDRAPSLINATSLPAAKFGSFLQTERAAAVVYLFAPDPNDLQAYDTAITKTDQNEPAFTAAMTSPATVSSETPAEAKAISAIISNLSQLTALRGGVKARALSPLQALELYSQGLAAQPKLFLIEANSVSNTAQLGQALGLIATVQAREQLSQEDALLAGMLAGQQITTQDRVAFTRMAATRQADTQYADNILSPANLASYNAQLSSSGPMQVNLGNVEQTIAAGEPVQDLGITLPQWQQLAGTLLQDDYNGGVAVAGAILVADHQISRSAWVKVAVTGGIGADPGRDAAAGRDRPAAAQRGGRRGGRGAAAAGGLRFRGRRDQPGGSGLRPGPADRHPGRGGRGQAAARAQRRVPQPGPAQPVTAAPPAGPARPDGAAGHRPRGAR
jgi:hypothetical protein